MITRRYWTMMVAGLIGMLMGLRVEAAPVITAKDGILYQDGKPCFLTGVWSFPGYSFALRINADHCEGEVEIVPGRKGNAAKIGFHKSGRRLGRWCDFEHPAPDCSVWPEKKYKFLKFWLKGDGSDTTVDFKAENWDELRGTTNQINFGTFALKDTDWKQIVFPLEDKYENLAKTNRKFWSLSSKGGDREFHYVIDEITLSSDEEEVVLYDFEKGTASRAWSCWNEREKFKDDLVYKAVWNDPLYREISRESFETIGMSTFHLAVVSDGGLMRDIIPSRTGRSLSADVYLCEALKGMPMVPGFVFDWGEGNPAKYAEQNGLPVTMYMRTPDGGFVGGYSMISFADPFGRKLYKEYWQRGARLLLENGANIYAYELINENAGYHNDAHPYERELFIKRLKEKYGDISGVNKVWGTDYESFDKILKMIPQLGGLVPKMIKGLSVEWQKFQEDRYAELLYQGGEWIHEIEDELGKPRALMAHMGYPAQEFMGWGGTDLYKMARKLDVTETEGGVSFGSEYDIGEVNRLTEVMASKSKFNHLMCSDLGDAASWDKPIINTEHYFMRAKGGRREPTTKADIITSLWEEFLRGVSAVHTYSWEVAYLNREDALAKGLTNRQLLSPHVVPRESLNGYKEINEEIERVVDVVMSRPRLGRNAKVAVLFSRPTARYLVGLPGWIKDAEQENIFQRSHKNLYAYLLENHYPMRYLYEERLPEQNINEYKVILVPHSDYIYPDTLKYLSDYVRKGGILVCFGNAFKYDEYGNEEDNSGLMGLKQKKTDAFVKRVESGSFGGVEVMSEREFALNTARTLVGFPGPGGAPFITVNEAGRGKVFCINADTFKLDDKSIKPIMNYITGEINLSAPIEVVGLNGEKQENIEAHVIEKGNKKVVFIVNWMPYRDRVVKVRLPDLRDRDKYYLVDIVKNSIYTKDGERIFTGEMLKQGINLYLPEEERVVLLLTKKRYESAQKSSELMSDKEAGELDKKIRMDIEREAAEAGNRKKMVFGLYEAFSPESNAKCKGYMKMAAGDALKKIELQGADTTWTTRNSGLTPTPNAVMSYELTYNDSLGEEETARIQDKIIDALNEKDKIKVITGYSASGFQNRQKYKSGGCAPLDIRKQANMGLVDEKADDQKGGLFDEGRSLVNLPLGKQQFAGVPFEIIDPAQNNGKVCIVLKGQPKPYFPEKAEGIEVKRKARNVYVLHNACYCGSEGVVYKLRLNYVDGSKAEVEIRAGSEIKDWFNRDPLLRFSLPNAKLGWQGKAVEKSTDGEKEHDVALYCAKLVNPNPEKEVTTMDLVSANGKAVPAVFGITVEE